jgi:hypothetical protein
MPWILEGTLDLRIVAVLSESPEDAARRWCVSTVSYASKILLPSSSSLVLQPESNYMVRG